MVAQASGPALRAGGAVVDVIAEAEGPAICPRCHAVDPTMTLAALARGGDWRCQRCSQRWDKDRIAAVAAYDAWAAARLLQDRA